MVWGGAKGARRSAPRPDANGRRRWSTVPAGNLSRPRRRRGRRRDPRAGRLSSSWRTSESSLQESDLLIRPREPSRKEERAMPRNFDLVLANGTVVNHDGVGVRDIGVRDGRIAEIGDLRAASADERVECRGLHILPGVIDTQVHFREPGLVHKEDLETGSRAAPLGGVPAVFQMPNTDPPTTTAQAPADTPPPPA